MDIVAPRTLKGFRDLLPARALHQQRLVRTLEDVFRSHGYGPIDTPALEYAEILMGKGEDADRELFAFEDKGGRKVALRFDLTVPLARFVAEHHAELSFPFRRSHVGSCWRGERPQRGRAREFLQCDADLVGATGPAADAEILVLMLSAYAALDVGPVTLRLNDRRILNGILQAHAPGAQPAAVLRAIDKREKQGEEAVLAALDAAGVRGAAATTLLDAASPAANDEATRARLAEAVADSELGRVGLHDLDRTIELVVAAGLPRERLKLDPSIARGLDYYTGIVLEAQLDALPAIGAVGSGGRYDDLASLYTKHRLPGVGCSIGLTRLLDALADLGRAEERATAIDVLVVHPAAPHLERAFAVAGVLRALGLAAVVHPEPAKHGQQMRWADKQGVRVVATIEDDGTLHAKRLADGTTHGAADAKALAAWMQS